MKKKKFKIRYILLVFLFIVVLTPFIWWQAKSGSKLDIIVLNKTFPFVKQASGESGKLDYSKQRGLFWLLDYLKIKQPGTKGSYDVRTDYYGNFLVDGKLTNKPLSALSEVPDVIYLSDMYGTGNSKSNGEEGQGVSGLTKEEIGVISTSYERGTTVIGEYNIAGDPTKPSVAKELEEIFGVRFAGLAGKFFSDLSSAEDVPNWIKATYEQQYGKKWSLTGAGIVIAGNNRIVVLQRDIGFTGQSLRVTMDKDTADAYKTQTVDYYNWFEIVQPEHPDSVIAWYELDLTEEGADQLKPFGLDRRFPAIIDNRVNHKHSYYFAGDFTDYRGPTKLNQFVGAAMLYRYFSVESEGDLSYFYWHFYVPFMSKVLKDVKPVKSSMNADVNMEVSSDGTKLGARIADGRFSVFRDGSWQKLYVKGVNIGATVPGKNEGEMPDSPAFYKDWFSQIAGMNANAIRVYTLMPPVFYRALDEYNFNNAGKKMYLLQNIVSDQKNPPQHAIDDVYRSEYRKRIETTINAIHGHATVTNEKGNSTSTYMNDVSGYLLAYLVDPDWNPDVISVTDVGTEPTAYAGEFVSAGAGATRTEAWLASVLDEVYRYEQQNYGMQHPVGVVSNPELDRNYRSQYSPADAKTDAAMSMAHIDASDRAKGGIFGALDLFPNQPGLLAEDHGADAPSFEAYKKYLLQFVKSQEKYPVLVSEFGVPTSSGLSEKNQGDSITALLSIIKDSGAMGGLIYEWADEWGKSNRFSSSLMIPYNRGKLWHNVDDPSQNYGILAMASKTPSEYAMTLRGSNPLDTLALTADESYFYVKAEFSKFPDLTRKNIMIYLDTFDRKRGEYMLAPDIVENWSGAEFNIRIQQPTKAELLVIPSYNASKGHYFSMVSTTGLFEKATRQLSASYVTKSGKQLDTRYEDISTLTSGPFENSTNAFYLTGNTLNIRIPWARLNFSDPSSLLVLNDDKTTGVLENKKDTLTVRMTDGVVASLVVMDKKTNAVDYHFPESVTSSGYKTFTWSSWDAPQYEQRQKSSYDSIKEAFSIQ
ncbi:hypothetical protein [Cohnella soli]|uniref:Uncharacterized protein n=1 Tax=Cohnella soli TaxID=425005 RepID=A0ABW0HLU5_9BACL